MQAVPLFEKARKSRRYRTDGSRKDRRPAGMKKLAQLLLYIKAKTRRQL